MSNQSTKIYSKRHIRNNIVLFFSSIAVLALLNIGLHRQLAPKELDFATLPYHLDDTLYAWKPVSGEWQLSFQGLSATTSRGANEAALIASPINLEAGSYVFLLRLEPNAGVVFHSQKRYALNGSHLIEVEQRDDGLYLVASYTNELGSKVVQAEKNIDQNSKAYVRVETDKSSYRVFADETLLFNDIPLMFDRGNVLFRSKEQAHIQDFQVTTPELYVDATLDGATYANHFNRELGEAWNILSGYWSVQGGQLIQSQKTGFDHIAVYALQAREYRLKVVLEHLEGIGAGVLFNLPSKFDVSGGHLIRFNGDNPDESGIFWGYFDPEQGFQGSGYAAFPLRGVETLELEIFIRADTYGFSINGEEIADGVPLQSPQGFLGLTSSESVIAFDAIELYRLKEGE